METKVLKAILAKTKKTFNPCPKHGEPAPPYDGVLAEVAYKEGIRKAIRSLRNHKDYKVMARLVGGYYRNMLYESDWDLLLEELGIDVEAGK